MKKYTVFALAALLVVAFCVPAMALENKFGGYWRTRAYTNQDFSGDDSESMDWTVVDTRTRIYYTAKLNDDLKFVNKFEFDAVWGDSGYGDIGADGKNVEVKNSYAEFNVGTNLTAKVGVHGGELARGFLFSDDFAGATVTMKGEGASIPFMWIKPYEGNNSGMGLNKRDVDYFAINPTFKAGEALTLNPFIMYVTSDNAQDWSSTSAYEDLSIYYVGVDGAIASEAAEICFTAIYQGGDGDLAGGTGSEDFSAFLAAGGVTVKFGPHNVHGQAFYATGDDNADSDNETFWVPKGQSYYWSEIMGYGIFDKQGSNNAPEDQISNVMAANAGVKLGKLAEGKLTLTFDVWYAALAEDDANGETDLGIELDAKATVKLVEGLNLDIVGAYLLAGDATTGKASNDADPFEVGTRLSLKF